MYLFPTTEPTKRKVCYRSKIIGNGRELASCMHHVHHLDARRCDAIKNDVIGMGHDFAQAWTVFASPIKIRVFETGNTDAVKR